MDFWIFALGVAAVTVYLLWRSRSGLRDATQRKEGIANAGVPPALPGPGFGGGSPGG